MNVFLKPKFSLFHFNMSVPHLKVYPPYYSVVNYESNALDSDKSLLQKVEIHRSERNDWVVSVSEFNIEIDYFFLLSPDDQTKCKRKLQLNSKWYDPNLLAMEYSSEGFSYKKDFSLRCRIIDQNFLFKNLPDRKISEEKVRRIFFDFQREQWGINDGILSQELSREEEELERRIIAKVSRKKQVQDQVDQEFDVRVPEDEVLSSLESFGGEMVKDIAPTDAKRLLTEDELWESRDLESFDGEMVTDIAPINDEKRVLTEDELWESRGFLCSS